MGKGGFCFFLFFFFFFLWGKGESINGVMMRMKLISCERFGGEGGEEDKRGDEGATCCERERKRERGEKKERRS